MSELAHPEPAAAALPAAVPLVDAAAPASVSAHGLSELEQAILAFESRWREHVGAKEEAIREQLELTPSRYYQLLGRLLDSRVALAHDPMLVKRLRRIRDQRAAVRAQRERALGR